MIPREIAAKLAEIGTTVSSSAGGSVLPHRDGAAMSLAAAHAKAAGLTPRRQSFEFRTSKPHQNRGRADHRHCEAAREHGDHRVGKHPELQGRSLRHGSAAVAAGSLAILLDREVLLIGIALGGRALRAAPGIAVVAAAERSAERARGFDIIGRVARPGRTVVGHGRRDRGYGEHKGSDGSGDTGLHKLFLAPLRSTARDIRSIFSCVMLIWGRLSRGGVPLRTQRLGLAGMEALL